VKFGRVLPVVPWGWRRWSRNEKTI